MVQIGGHTPNEVRVINDLEPVDGGDKLYLQVNLAPLGMSPSEMQERKLEQDATARVANPPSPEIEDEQRPTG
jgi:hypothetical protein